MLIFVALLSWLGPICDLTGWWFRRSLKYFCSWHWFWNDVFQLGGGNRPELPFDFSNENNPRLLMVYIYIGDEILLGYVGIILKPWYGSRVTNKFLMACQQVFFSEFPHNWVGFHPLNNPEQRFGTFFFIAHLIWFLWIAIVHALHSRWNLFDFAIGYTSGARTSKDNVINEQRGTCHACILPERSPGDLVVIQDVVKYIKLQGLFESGVSSFHPKFDTSLCCRCLEHWPSMLSPKHRGGNFHIAVEVYGHSSRHFSQYEDGILWPLEMGETLSGSPWNWLMNEGLSKTPKVTIQVWKMIFVSRWWFKIFLIFTYTSPLLGEDSHFD